MLLVEWTVSGRRVYLLVRIKMKQNFAAETQELIYLRKIGRNKSFKFKL